MHTSRTGTVAAAIFCVFATSVRAQQPEDITTASEVATEDVVVTATRFAEPVSEHIIGTQVIRGEQIRASGVRTLPEYLSQRAGIYSRDNFGSPNQQLDLRGFGISGDQNTLVLVDGQRISENEQVPADLASVPLSSIERIEIVRGSGAVLYGGGATGGTINIITRGASRNDRAASVKAGYGSYDTRVLAAGASVAGDDAGISVHASQYQSENYRENNDLRQRNFQSDVRIFGRRGPIYLKAGAGDQDLRLPGSRTEQQLLTDRRGTDTPDDYGTLRSSRINLGTRLQFDTVETAIDLTHRERDAFSVNQPGRIDIEGRDTAFSPRLRLPVAFGVTHELVAGIDWDRWEYATRSEFPPFAPSALNSTQTNSAVFINDSFSLGSKTRVSAGARAQRVETTIRDVTGGTPEKLQKRDLEAWQLALRHALSPKASLYVKAGKSFRVANIDDNRFVAEPLEPQTSRDSEVGADLSGEQGSIRIAAYRMEIENEIAFLPSDVLPPFGGNVNLPPTERKGFELEASWNAASWLVATGQYSYSIARYREGNFGGVDVAGNNVPLVPRHRAGLSASVKATPHLSMTAMVSYVGEQYYDNDQSNSFGRKMPAYTVTDVSATYQLRNWTFQGSVRNLFNELYYSYAIRSTTAPTFNAYPSPERSLLFTALYRF